MASLNILNTVGKLATIVESTGLTQAAWYAKNGASSEMVSLVALGNKAFGSAMEHITCNIFKCEKVKDVQGETGWDLCRNDFHIELKSSRLWRVQQKTLWRWQHVLPDHEWSYLMCAGVDIDKIRYFIISKPQFMDLISMGIVTQQGGAGGQGCWFSSPDIIWKIHEFKDSEKTGISFSEQLDIFIAENPASNDAVSSEEIEKALGEGMIVKELRKAEKKETMRLKKEAKLIAKKRRADEKAEKRAEKNAIKEAKKAEKKAIKEAKKAEKKAIKEAKAC